MPEVATIRAPLELLSYTGPTVETVWSITACCATQKGTAPTVN
jgi:hypothetical protein